jgi:hypothetical protein
MIVSIRFLRDETFEGDADRVDAIAVGRDDEKQD